MRWRRFAAQSGLKDGSLTPNVVSNYNELWLNGINWHEPIKIVYVRMVREIVESESVDRDGGK